MPHVYHVTADGGDNRDIAICASLKGARDAVLAECQNRWTHYEGIGQYAFSTYPEKIDDIQPWFENGLAETDPEYSCEYIWDDISYYINPRELKE